MQEIFHKIYSGIAKQFIEEKIGKVVEEVKYCNQCYSDSRLLVIDSHEGQCDLLPALKCGASCEGA